MKGNYFNAKICNKIRTLLKQGFRINGIPCLLSELEFYYPEVACIAYPYLPDDAQLQLRMLECSVFLEQFADVTDEETTMIQNLARFGFSICNSDFDASAVEYDNYTDAGTAYLNIMQTSTMPWQTA